MSFVECKAGRYSFGDAGVRRGAPSDHHHLGTQLWSFVCSRRRSCCPDESIGLSLPFVFPYLFGGCNCDMRMQVTMRWNTEKESITCNCKDL